jgi:2-polyprenyl-3-methyl-5-hydroxy-6-metoxy-1,4-benzoquinol methylase
MELGPRGYNFVQKVTRIDHGKACKVFKRLMDLKPGETIVDIGCGTGLLTPHLTGFGLNYVGFDLDVRRVEAAKRLYPDLQFVGGDVMDPKLNEGVNFEKVLMHGVLHHMPDADIRRLFAFLKEKKCKVLGVLDPERPNSVLSNPLGEAFIRLDRGQFVRRRHEYEKLFEGFDDLTVEGFQWWPSLPFYSVCMVGRMNYLQN